MTEERIESEGRRAVGVSRSGHGLALSCDYWRGTEIRSSDFEETTPPPAAATLGASPLTADTRANISSHRG